MSSMGVFAEPTLPEMSELLATVVVHIDFTKANQRRDSSDLSFTSDYIGELWDLSRVYTALMRFQTDHLQIAVVSLRKQLKEVLGGILEFEMDRGAGSTIPTRLENGFNLKYVPSTYEYVIIW